MLQTRTRKIWRDIWARKTRTILTALSIFIGVFGVVALSSAGEILVRQLEKDIQTDKLATLKSAVSLNPAVANSNGDLLTTLSQHIGVESVEARAVYPLYWRLENEERFRESVIAAHSEPFEQSQIEPTRLVEGRYPATTGNPDKIEIGIEQRFANEFDLGLGDTVAIRVLTGAEGDTPIITTGEIVGIIFQAYTYNSASGVQATPDTVVFATYEDASYVGGFKGYSSIYARFIDFATTEAEQESFTADIAQLGYIPTFTVTQDPDKNPAIESTQATNRILIVLAVAALVVSGLLIVNVINSIVVEQRRQIGLMKSLGASTRDNLFIYVGIALSYGLLGVIPGVILGLPAGYFFAQGLAMQSQTIITDFAFSPLGLVLGVILGLAIPVASAIIPVFLGIRVSILDAMTDFGISANFGTGIVGKLVGSLPLPFSLRQAVRNAYLKAFRLALTGLTLTFASAAFMAIFGVFSGLTTLVTNAFETNGNQLSISPNSSTDFVTVKTLLEEEIPSVSSVDPETSLAIGIDGYTPPPIQAGPPGLFAVGFNAQNPDILRLDYKEGNGWNDDPNRDGVVLSSQLATALEKGLGDTIVMIAGGNRAEFEIIGIARFPGNTVWIDWQDLAEFGGLVDAEGNPYPNNIAVTLEGEDLTGREVDDAILEINDVLLANGISSSFNNQVELAELINTIVAGVGVTFSLAAFLIALVGAVGLLSTLSMSVFERQKEIGVMRSVGATSSAVALQFLAEGLIVGVISWIIAAPLSFWWSTILIDLLPFGGDFQVDYPPSALVVGLVGMLVLVIVASLIPSLTAANRTVSDILRYQ